MDIQPASFCSLTLFQGQDGSAGFGPVGPAGAKVESSLQMMMFPSVTAVQTLEEEAETDVSTGNLRLAANLYKQIRRFSSEGP